MISISRSALTVKNTLANTLQTKTEQTTAALAKPFQARLLALMLAGLLTACTSSDSDPDDVTDPTEPPDPTQPEEVEMTQGDAYNVSPNDRLVNTSPEAAKVRVHFRLDEETAEDSATATLLEGEANLYR
ncbi:hypothetical protein [Marinimicrobium sp. ABcell2]|uniref:hypothetical protein n=1 Tax=Marinimicrobium sp. ABcell2 TaxID=3069751 RepID=UPI0027B39FFC|nr:hypothetical protein [Marinimicrobium sp. ABcell2]MDQ2077992.1 hypothetical protein [Marinimicrobium sp. ABcell2]